MGLFGKSFEDKVQEAVGEMSSLGLKVKGLRADVVGKVVTLHGEAPDLQAKKRVMREFNARIETENTINALTLAPGAQAAPPPAPAPAPERIHEVVRGDTLSGIAKHYYGKASLYMKIFEANRDQLSNPDLIKVGQKLKIPD
jgi:nucleoid-associated protein YgaU